MKITNIDTFIEEFRNGRDIWSRTAIELVVREIERLRKENHLVLMEVNGMLKKTQARKQELEAEIKESNDLLRSAFMIAKRDGKDTNWEAWHNQLSVALARQHAMMYGKDEK